MVHVFDLASEVLQRSRLWTHPEIPFQFKLHAGDPRLLLIAGENASGKSLFAQCLASLAHRQDIAPITVSIRERTGSGLSGIEGFRKVCMFGDESEQSTGATSFKVIPTAFNTLQGRADADKRAFLLLDEPDLGLSEGYSGALGRDLAGRYQSVGPSAAGLALVTHSRALVRGLLAGVSQPPSFIKFGETADLTTWLAGEPERSAQELKDLHALSLERWRAVRRILDELRLNR